MEVQVAPRHDTRAVERGLLDRITMHLATRISRRSLFKGGALGIAGLAGLKVLGPMQALACDNCHYCTSGCVGCGSLECCSYGGYCQICSGCGGYFYVKNYVCDGYCGSWCATSGC